MLSRLGVGRLKFGLKIATFSGISSGISVYFHVLLNSSISLTEGTVDKIVIRSLYSFGYLERIYLILFIILLIL